MQFLTNPDTYRKHLQQFKNKIPWTVVRRKSDYALCANEPRTVRDNIPISECAYCLFHVQFVDFTAIDKKESIMNPQYIPLDDSDEFFMRFNDDWHWDVTMKTSLAQMISSICFGHHNMKAVVEHVIVMYLIKW
jgi:hypothetical protein